MIGLVSEEGKSHSTLSTVRGPREKGAVHRTGRGLPPGTAPAGPSSWAYSLQSCEKQITAD